MLATGCILQKKPKTMCVHFTGNRPIGVTAKDMILALIRKIGVNGGNGHVIEYTGPAIQALSMEERMTICNMSIECGARAGLIGPDDTTFAYIKDKIGAPKEHEVGEGAPLLANADNRSGVRFMTKEAAIFLSDMAPMVTWGINPEQSIAYR